MTIPMNCWVARKMMNKTTARMKPHLALMSMSGLFLLAGCNATGTHITATPASDSLKEPVIIVADLKDQLTAGPRYNAHGGIIPEAAPTVRVSEDGLHEVPTD